jgi:homopolymeric O-antigen transport system ATP-binding protein
MGNIALQAENLSKLYKIGLKQRRQDTLRDQISHGFRSVFRRNGHTSNRDEMLWALKDVSFELKHGDVAGIIGRNGAGKSTLLKVLSRITAPTTGTAKIFGRVGSLLEVGTGFHAELTGRENVYLNGAILGMRKVEIDRKFDEIVDFSGIEKFLDTPVKRYSTGMYVRLAFAVAAHLEPEVLIVDEVLAVGDSEFQKKCLGKMENVAQAGRTILFVSHNMAAVENLCNKGVVLNAGRIVFSGTSNEAVDHYTRSFSAENDTGENGVVDLRKASGRPTNYRPFLTRLELFTDGGVPVNGGIKVGARLKVSVSFRLEQPTSQVHVNLGFNNHVGQRVCVASTTCQPNWPDEKRTGDQKFVCDIPSLTLVPGEYRIKVLLDVAGTLVDCVWDAVRLTVLETDYYGTGRFVPDKGFFVVKQHWSPE